MKKPADSPKTRFAVGYGKPPLHTRFQPGQSGNPKGRSKGSLNLATAVNRALKEKVVIIENGQRKSITKLDAAVKGLVNRAVKGDARAMHDMLALAPLVGMEALPLSAGLDANEASLVAGLMKRFGVVSDDTPSDPK